MAKYASNCFYAAKISFFNELALAAKKLDVDSDEVRRIVQLDRYYPIHPQFHGKPFGGACLPKDLSAAISFFEEDLDFNPRLLKATYEVNESMKALELQTDKIKQVGASYAFNGGNNSLTKGSMAAENRRHPTSNAASIVAADEL
jgi:UDP-glucose 6-dehydrogenase